MSRFIYSPLSPVFFIVLILLVLIGLPLLFLGVIGTALSHIGFNIWAIIALIIGIILGSFVNIPIATLHPRNKEEKVNYSRKPRGQYAPSMYDKMYRTERFDLSSERVARNEKPGTKICINIGGCLIPVCLCGYVIIMAILGNVSSDPFYLLKMLGGVAATTILAYFLARTVKGIGIAIPFFVTPLMAILCGLLLGWGFGPAAAGIAFVSGTLGTLIGADLLHLKDISGNETQMLSIGGAGTFDGIFLSGIIAAFITAL